MQKDERFRSKVFGQIQKLVDKGPVLEVDESSVIHSENSLMPNLVNCEAFTM